jgi:hypothetical protein
LEIKAVKGEIITIRCSKKANYRAQRISFTKNGLVFQVYLDRVPNTYFD